MIKALCIDNKNRPFEVPPFKWINEGTVYHIVHIFFHPNQKIQGVELREVKLTNCSPYETFRLDRFAFDEEGIKALIEMMKNCSELNEVDINKLIEESNLVIQEEL